MVRSINFISSNPVKMKTFLSVSALLLFSWILNGQKNLKKPEDYNAIKDRMSSYHSSFVSIGGYLGAKIDLVVEKRIKGMDSEHLIEPFRHRNETRQWQSEFWGKWIQSAVAAYNYTRDPQLAEIIKNTALEMIGTQTPDGYIGNYAPESQLKEWDIWGRKYTLLGLMACYDVTRDKQILKSARLLADHLITQLSDRKLNIVKAGNYRGMPSSSILEPMVLLYRLTGEKKYLDFAQSIVDQWETAEGPGLINKALNGVAVSMRFPHPETWWSYENGQKAYEMMSCYDGLLELYRITGKSEYLKAVEMAADNIIHDEINLAGSGTAFECFYNGAKYQTEPTYHTMETCVTMTWMKLCHNLLKLTGDPKYADQIETSAYNALAASLKDDGMQIAKYSPLGGIRHAGEEQCGMHINCCNANGPRAFMMLPAFVIMGNGKELFINLYGKSRAQVPFDDKNIITVEQSSEYPVTGDIEIRIIPEKATTFTVSLRIPSWSEKTVVSVNGEILDGITPGTYARIRREWKKDDRIGIKMDMRGRLVTLNGNQAIVRGPVLLARDTRFHDGFVYETADIRTNNGYVDLQPVEAKEAGVWMAFTAPLILGTDLEGEFRNPKQISFCDFASAGNTWGEESRYKVWIPKTLNVMKTDYKSY
jgi:DUF1680 family protein